MRIPRKALISLTVLFLLFLAAFASSAYLRSRVWEVYFEVTHANPTVTTAQQLDEILSGFEKLRYQDLPKEYLARTQADQSPYAKMMKGGTYYKVPYMHIHRKLVGSQRLGRFMPRDAYFSKATWNPRRELIWLVNVKVLKKYLELHALLEKEGYNPYAMYVVNGYRYPRYNKKVGGASRSRHIKGEAIDLSIGDINRDGRSNKEDKDIVLKLLDQKVIKSFGGLGRYPGSQSVHMDVRGYRARWDQQ
ncbi:MAG: D-Ala-D-Ala carboxypeptidase family metallohydrolase [Bacteroidota bacterium]